MEITVAFIGYLAVGGVGAVLAAAGVFLPCYLSEVLLAPSFRRLSGDPSVKTFLDGVAAAATGATAGAARVLARRAIVDLPVVMIGFVTLAAQVYLKKSLEPEGVVVAGIVCLGQHGVM